jgi:hypothetical protein
MLFKETNLGRLILESVPLEKSAEKKIKFDASEAVKISSGLSKIASYEYNDKVYHSVQEIMKIASEFILELKSVCEESLEKNAQLEKAAEVRTVIEDMVLHGLLEEHDMQEKIADLMTKPMQHIEVVKEAVKLASGGKSENIFSSNDDSSLSKTASSKKGIFDNVIS